MTPAGYDSGSAEDVGRARKHSRRRQQRHDADFRWLMGEERGRRLVWGWLANAGVFTTSMRATPEMTAFAEGQRNAGLALLADIIRLCPDLYQRMVAETRPPGAASEARPDPNETNGDDDGSDDGQ